MTYRDEFFTQPSASGVPIVGDESSSSECAPLPLYEASSCVNMSSSVGICDEEEGTHSTLSFTEDASYATNQKVEAQSMGTNSVSSQVRASPIKRPMSAYNMFFQLERQRIIEGLPQRRFTRAEVDEMIEKRKLKELTPSKPKRKHRKTHGKISFGDLARAVANQWKSMSKEDKHVFHERAALEKEEQKKAFEAWSNSLPTTETTHSQSARQVSPYAVKPSVSCDMLVDAVANPCIPNFEPVGVAMTTKPSTTTGVKKSRTRTSRSRKAPTLTLSNRDKEELKRLVKRQIELEELVARQADMLSCHNAFAASANPMITPSLMQHQHRRNTMDNLPQATCADPHSQQQQCRRNSFAGVPCAPSIESITSYPMPISSSIPVAPQMVQSFGSGTEFSHGQAAPNHQPSSIPWALPSQHSAGSPHFVGTIPGNSRQSPTTVNYTPYFPTHSSSDSMEPNKNVLQHNGTSAKDPEHCFDPLPVKPAMSIHPFDVFDDFQDCRNETESAYLLQEEETEMHALLQCCLEDEA